jgi:hypothetical protein
VPDEVEPCAGAAVEFGTLGFKLLNIVFTEVAEAEFVSLAHHRRGKFLGDRQKKNVTTAAPRAGSRVSNSSLDEFQILFQHQPPVARPSGCRIETRLDACLQAREFPILNHTIIP